LARLPIRILGLILLAVALSVGSCQALLHGLTESEAVALETDLDSQD